MAKKLDIKWIFVVPNCLPDQNLNRFRNCIPFYFDQIGETVIKIKTINKTSCHTILLQRILNKN